jgi:hypothetical protein
MSKINVNFNNKVYSIDETDFSNSISELKNHLSTKMNGTGEVVRFNGTNFEIDSTKLQAA